MRIREAQVEDAKGIAYVHVSSWRTTYRGIINESTLASMNIEQRQKTWEERLRDKQGISTVFVAQSEEGDIVGYIRGGQSRSPELSIDGELYAIYLLEGAQGKGIGKALLLRLVQWMIERQYDKMLVWVLKDNTNRMFYTLLGAAPLTTSTFTMDGGSYEEDGLVWHDLSKLQTMLEKE